MTRRKQHQTGNRRRRGNKRGKNTMPLTRQPRVSSFAQSVAPPETSVRLDVLTVGTISGASQAQLKRWLTNSAYTPEVGGGSGATKGYSNWAQLYSFYRVVSYSYTAVVVNNEAFPVVVYAVNTNADPGTTTNSTVAENSLSQSRMLSAKGGQDRIVFKGRYRVAEIIGSESVETDDDYRAAITNSPSDVTWLGLGVQSANGSNVTNGISFQMRLRQYTRFYDRSTL